MCVRVCVRVFFFFFSDSCPILLSLLFLLLLLQKRSFGQRVLGRLSLGHEQSVSAEKVKVLFLIFRSEMEKKEKKKIGSTFQFFFFFGGGGSNFLELSSKN